MDVLVRVKLVGVRHLVYSQYGPYLRDALRAPLLPSVSESAHHFDGGEAPINNLIE